MGLESASFINDLIITNPPGSDLTSQGDDHIRMLKTVLRNSFPNASHQPYYFPEAQAKSASFSVLSSDMNQFFAIDTTSGAVVVTLPTLDPTADGWNATFIKASIDTNPIFLQPPSGTIISGQGLTLTKTRRCIPGIPFRAVWSGAFWAAERVLAQPIGSIIPYAGPGLPVGFEAFDGGTLGGTGGSLYPDYYAVMGSLVKPALTSPTLVFTSPVTVTNPGLLVVE